MKRSLRGVTLQLLLMLSFAGWCDAAAGNLRQGEPRLTVLLRLHDAAEADPDVLAEAMSRVGAVYADIGVSTQWARVHGLAREQKYGLATLDVSLVGGEVAPHLAIAVAGEERVLGQAAVAVDRAYVFYDRLMEAAVSMRRFPGNLLGDVIAHEIGHLLLPPGSGSHSERGIMRANVSWNEILYTFDEDQARIVRLSIQALAQELTGGKTA